MQQQFENNIQIINFSIVFRNIEFLVLSSMHSMDFCAAKNEAVINLIS